MATQAHHEWMKTYLRMLGIGSGSGASAPEAAQSSIATPADGGREDSASGMSLSMPSNATPANGSASGEGMSQAENGQSQDSPNGANGISLAAPAAAAGATAIPAPDGANSEQKTATSTNVITAAFNKNTPKAHFLKTTTGGGRFEVELTAWYEIKGTVEGRSLFAGPAPGAGGEASKAGGDTAKKNVVSFGFDDTKCAASIGQSWANEEGFKIFDLETAITDVDHKISLAANLDELEIAYEAAATLSCGASVSIKATLITLKSGAKVDAEFCDFAVGASIPPFKVKDYPVPDMRGVTIRGISLVAHVEGNATPVWAKIGQDVLKAVGTGAAFDIAIVAGMVAAAIGSVLASLHQLIEGDEINNAGQAADEATDALTEGFRLGITGGQAPADEIAKMGFEAGSQTVAKMLATVKQKVPDVADDVAKQWIGEFISENDLVTNARSQFLAMAAEATWRHYAEKYSYSPEYQMTAFTHIYQPPRPRKTLSDPLFKNYATVR